MPTYTANTRTLTAKPRSKRMQQGAIATAQVVQGGGSVQGNYLPATNNGDGYDVADKVAFLQKIRIGAPDTIVDGVVTQVNGIDIEVDTSNGAVHVKGGLYADDFISALGAHPDGSSGSGGLDETALWQILEGANTDSHRINSAFLPAYSWSSIDGKPSWIGSSKPSYSWSEITGKPSWIGSSKPSYSWSEITGKPSTFAPSTHSHNFSELSGTVTNAQLAGSIANGKLANSSITIAGVTVSLGSSITQASLRTALGLGSNAYTSTAYLPLAGGTMTGVLTLKANQYSGANGYGMNCNNSDLFNVNSIITADNAESFGEGIMFWRSSTPTYDCLTATGGTFYFGANKTYGATLTGDANINCGSINVNQSAWDNGIVIKRTAVSGGAGIKALDSNNNVLGTFGINGSKQFEVDIDSTQYALITSSITQLGRTDISNYALNIYSSTARLRLLANSNGNTYIQSCNPAFTASADMHITGYNSNNVSNLYLHANKLGVGQSSGLTTELDVYGTVRSRAYNANGNNHAAFVFDKPGSNLTGLGSCNETDTIYFGACDAAGAWVSYSQLWKFGGSIYATGAVTALETSASDRRLKTDIKEFDALSIVDMLKPKSFRWNSTAKALDSAFDTNDTQYGLIAQEVADVMPSLAFKFQHNEYMGVRYEKLIPILLQAVKEQQAEIDSLKAEVAELKKIVKRLIGK